MTDIIVVLCCVLLRISHFDRLKIPRLETVVPVRLRLRHHIEVSFVSSERRRVDLLETEKRDEAQSSGLYALPT